MDVYTTEKSLITALSQYREKGKIGFVPTMGALHDGHLALVSKSLIENECTIVSIFVNPTQFNNAKDLEKYPRTLKSDTELLKKLDKNIIVFAPTAEELYKGEVKATTYNFDGLEGEMEGKHRKGHFDGVGTVLNLLFRLIKPDNAYFGEKDFQQLQIVKKMVEIEKLPVKIIGCKIIREKSGLAMSSRNKRLSNSEKEEAALINKTLKKVKKDFKTRSIAEINKMVAKTFEENKILRLEYFEIAEIQSLKTAITKIENIKYRAFIAAFAGEVRLIDNIKI